MSEAMWSLEPKDISISQFRTAREAALKASPNASLDTKVSYVVFAIGFITEAAFSFTGKTGSKFYPRYFCVVTGVHTLHESKYFGGGITTYEDPAVHILRPDVKPYDHLIMFDKHERECGQLGLHFWLPFGVDGALSSIEVERLFLSKKSGFSKLPEIALYEKWEEGGQIRHKTWFRETLTTDSIEYKKFAM